MSSPLNIIEIPELVHRKIMKRIVFANSGISIEKPLSVKPDLYIPCENIAAFRFGIRNGHLLKWTFYQQYFVEIKDYQNRISRIKLNCFYGINKKKVFKVWAELLERFWNFYMIDQLNFYTELFDLQQTFELSGVTFHADGISWDNENKLSWHEIAVSSFQTHFAIHHVEDLSKSKCCIFSIHWNAVVLQSLLNNIIKQPIRTPKPSWL